MQNVVSQLNNNFVVSLFKDYGKFLFFIVLIGIDIRLLEILFWYLGNDYSLSWETFFTLGMYNDWLTAVTIAVCCFPVLLLLNLGNYKMKKIGLGICFFIIIIVQLSLMLYFFKARYLLGSEVARYDLRQLYSITQTAAEWYEFPLMFIVVVIISIFLTKIFSVNKQKIGFLFYIVLGIVSIIFIPKNYEHITKIKDQRFFKDRIDFYQGNNKVSYFISSNMSKTKLDLTDVIPYQYYKPKPSEGTLCEYFDTSTVAPNVVIIIVESLSSSFSGESNYLGSYTPFLDSLAEHSLVWNNALSCAERTYGVLPNVLASAPQGGRIGMTNVTLNSSNYYPKQNSLIDQLKNNGYETSFIHGAAARYDHLDGYLNFLKVDSLYDEKYFDKENRFKKHRGPWSYTDSLVFAESDDFVNRRKKSFLQVLLTTGIHVPFTEISDSKIADTARFDKKIARTILRCDENIEQYFEKIKKQEFYQNTIFVITGDHNIAELKVKSPLEIFHVPLMIYSPKLRKSERFHSVVTHRDIAPSLYALLSNNYGVTISDSLTYFGNELNTSLSFETKQETTLCLNNGQSHVNLIAGKYYLMGEVVYEISDSLLNGKVVENETIKADLKKKYDTYQKQDAIGIELGLKP